jgi:transposase
MARSKRPVQKVDTLWTIPDNLWPAREDILLEFYPPAKTGRPRGSLRAGLDGILSRLRSGVPWNHLPREFGSDTTAHDWFQRFVADGVFERLWAVLIAACDELHGVHWDWQAADGVMTQARVGGTSSARTQRIAANRAPSGCSWSRNRAVRSGRSSRRPTTTTARWSAG